MAVFEVTRDGTEVEDAVYDVDPLTDTSNPFGNFCVVKMDDRDGEKFQQYNRGTRIDVAIKSDDGTTTFREWTGYVVEPREVEQQGADALEVEAYSFDQFLRRNTVTNDQTGNTIEQALQDIIQTDTPVTYNAANITIGDDQELTRSYQGVKVENVLRDLAFKSNNEEFGVNDSLEFFFRPRETEHIDRGIDNTQWFNYDIPELGKQAINEVEVWFNDGEESVIVDDGTDKLDLQDSLGLPDPGTQREELNRPLITDISDAEDIGRKYLQFRNATLSGTVTTYGLYNAEPGDTIDITIAPRGIDEEFVIAATEYRWGRDQTVLTIVEKRGEQDGILTELNDSVQRVEMEGANRDAPKNRITTTNAGAIVDVSVDADGNTPDGRRFVNDGRRAVRDGWAGKGNPAISNIVVGDDGGGLSRSNTTLNNQVASGTVSESLIGGTSVTYGFAETGGDGQTVDVSETDTITATLVGAGAGESADLEGTAGNPGEGGYIEAEIDVSGWNEITVYAPEAGDASGFGGEGWVDGGSSENNPIGGGGAAGAIVHNGSAIVAVDGGGAGGGGLNSIDNSQGGCGGARGGLGGAGHDGGLDGGDAAGTGFGGDGGDGQTTAGTPAEDGEDGGQEVVDTNRATLITENTGGGGLGNGEVTIDGLGGQIAVEYSAPITQTGVAELGLETSDGTLITRAVFNSPVDLDGTVTVTMDVSNDSSVSRGVLTFDGQTAVRDVLADNSPTLPSDYGYGSDGTAVSESDTALGNEVVSVSLEEVLIQSANTASEWQSIIADDLGDTDPVRFDNGGPEFYQTCFTREGEAYDRETGTLSSTNTDRYSNGNAVVFDASAEAEWDFSLGYTVPSGSFALPFRIDIPNDGSNPHTLDFELSINGGAFESIGNFNFAPISDPEWWDLTGRLASSAGDFTDPGEIPAGDHTLRITSRGDFSDSFAIDVIAPLADARFSYTFDNTLSANQGYLDGPELYPERVFELETATTRRNVTEANFSLTANAVDNGFYVELANDGSTFTRINNSETGSVTFASPESGVDTNIQLSRTNDGSSMTPLTGNVSQRIDSWELTANPDAVVSDGISSTLSRAVVPPNTSGVVGETILEAGLKSGSTLLTRHELAAFEVLADQRLASSEQSAFKGDN